VDKVKTVALITFCAFIGAFLMTTLFLPLCLGVTHSRYCILPVEWFVPLLIFLGSEGGASGVFAAIWIGYFVGLIALFSLIAWVRRKNSS
jgi:hypothetical protein